MTNMYVLCAGQINQLAVICEDNAAVERVHT
jgi:hypothetical protein